MKKLSLRIVTVLVLFAMIFPASGAMAQGLSRALPLNELSRFETYAGFSYDEASGEWSLRSNEAEALIRSMREGALRSYSSSGSVIFYLQIEGNSRTGLFAPYLYMEYIGPSLNATAVSFRVGDVRYDLPVHSQLPEEAGYEQLTALVGDAEMSMLRSLASAEKVTVRLHGDDSYTSEIRVKKTYNNVRERLEAASLNCVDLAEELAALNFGAVQMKDELSEAWYEKTGVRMMFETTDLAAEALPEGSGVPTLDKEMKMLSTEHSNANVKKLEDKLIEIHYLAGTANNAYGTSTKKAVEDIQRLYGLVPTGSADGRILNILFGNVAAPKAEAAEAVEATIQSVTGQVDAQAGEKYRIEKNAELTLNRYWFAGAVQTKKPVSAMSEYTSANRDNLLLIVDGTIANLMTTEMGFNRTVSAKAVYGGEYSFDMTVKCESDGGERFDSQLLPLGASRVVLMAEVPGAAAAGAEGWTVEVEIGGVTLVYGLE